MNKTNNYFLKVAIGTALTLSSFAGMANIEGVKNNLSKLNVPAGFKVDVYAEVPGARQMTLGTTGTVFVGTRGKHVYAVVDKNKDHKADSVISLMDDLNIGNGVAMHDGFLYVAEQNRIARYAAPDFDLNLPFKQMREVIYDKLPNKFHHGWRYIAFGPDNKLYVTVGAPCNVCDPEGLEASIIRMDPDGKNAETFASGIRNSVGMAFQPKSGTLYFTDNGADMMGDDIPAGELNAAPKKGMHFGFPFYAGGTDQHPRWKNKKAPKNITHPIAEFQAHSASLGLTFYTGEQFPKEFKGSAFIAQHGSWNRNDAVGYKIQHVSFDDNNQLKTNKTFIDGWLHNGESWGRPTDVLQMPDGSLLVSDDYNGVIYRISYGEGSASTTQTDSTTLTGLKMPESAIAHPDGRTFITEIGGFGTMGDGKVTLLNTDGTTKTLAGGLDDPKGIDLFNNQLYVADINQLIRIDLDGTKTVIAKASDFPGKPEFLNDVEIDGMGNVYISDSGDDNGKHASVYLMATDGKITEIINEQSGIKRPNGLLMDGPDKLLVADFGTGNLFRVTFTDPAKPQINLLNSGFGGGDGLVRDTNGMLYVSDWKNGKVWQLPEPKATPQLISEGHLSSADICLSADGSAILMPDMKAGKLFFLNIKH